MDLGLWIQDLGLWISKIVFTPVYIHYYSTSIILNP